MKTSGWTTNFSLRHQSVAQYVGAVLAARWLVWVFVGVGLGVRVRQYLANRALWIDEAALARNIVDRGFSQLFQQLDYEQSAPFGFLVLEHAAVHVFGPSEYALRLVPLLVSILALVLFPFVARAYVSPSAVLVAVALFAMLEPLVYYASEVKQYAGDVTSAVLVLFAAALLMQSPRPRRFVLFGIAGALLVWVSHPAAFMLGGVGATLGVWYARQHMWRHAAGIALIAGAWLASFSASYLVSLQIISNYQFFQTSWQDTYAPLSPTSFNPRWLAFAFFDLFGATFDVGAHAVAAMALACLLGGFALITRPPRFWLLVAPLLLALAASALQRYPFYGRLLLFAVPALVLLVAEGTEYVRRESRSVLIYIVLIGLIMLEPVTETGLLVMRPLEHEEVRSALDYIRQHSELEDTVYVYYGAEQAFGYYTDPAPLVVSDVRIGVRSRHDWDGYRAGLAQLCGRGRTWVLFSHMYGGDDSAEVEFFRYLLDQHGTQREAFATRGTLVYRYDMDTPCQP